MAGLNNSHYDAYKSTVIHTAYKTQFDSEINIIHKNNSKLSYKLI